jgi:hypothetical protein
LQSRCRVLRPGPLAGPLSREEKHLAYKITDPEGNEDWLCGYDVIQVIG